MMRLPVVSRARYDLLEHNFNEARTRHRVEMGARDAELAREVEASASWRALFEAERVRNDRLVAQLIAMKQQGFQTATERHAPTPRPPSKIEDAIAEKAGANTALRRHLTRWAAQRQSMNIPEDEIVDGLTNWRDPDADEAQP